MAFGKFLKEAVLEGMVFSGIVTLGRKLTEKGAEKLEKKIEKTLGLDIESAQKTTDDESLFETAIVNGDLDSTERKSIMDYLLKLRESNPKLAEEWVRWVHNTLVKLGRPVNISSGPVDNKEKKSFIDYSEGIKVVENLFKDIVSASDDNQREIFLKQRNICVPEKKSSPAVENIKKKTGEIFKGIKKDFKDVSGSEDFLARSKKFYEESKTRR